MYHHLRAPPFPCTTTCVHHHLRAPALACTSNCVHQHLRTPATACTSTCAHMRIHATAAATRGWLLQRGSGDERDDMWGWGRLGGSTIGTERRKDRSQIQVRPTPMYSIYTLQPFTSSIPDSFLFGDRSGKSTRIGERTNPETKEEDLTKMQVEKAERWRNDMGPRVLNMYIMRHSHKAAHAE